MLTIFNVRVIVKNGFWSCITQEWCILLLKCSGQEILESLPYTSLPFLKWTSSKQDTRTCPGVNITQGLTQRYTNLSQENFRGRISESHWRGHEIYNWIAVRFRPEWLKTAKLSKEASLEFCVIFKVLAAVSVIVKVVWSVAPWSLVDNYVSFGGA